VSRPRRIVAALVVAALVAVAAWMGVARWRGPRVPVVYATQQPLALAGHGFATGLGGDRHAVRLARLR
jgi:hypothetical protein